ncbi:uncharacterized protein LOC123481868 [Tachysurus ichikawai]
MPAHIVSKDGFRRLIQTLDKRYQLPSHTHFTRFAIPEMYEKSLVGTSVQQHLDNITQSSQPYLLAQGSTQNSIHSYFIVVDKHARPCKATGSVGAFDKLFKAHYVFGTSYSSSLSSFFTFVQTTIYNIDMVPP